MSVHFIRKKSEDEGMLWLDNCRHAKLICPLHSWCEIALVRSSRVAGKAQAEGTRPNARALWLTLFYIKSHLPHWEQNIANNLLIAAIFCFAIDVSSILLTSDNRAMRFCRQVGLPLWLPIRIRAAQDGQPPLVQSMICGASTQCCSKLTGIRKLGTTGGSSTCMQCIVRVAGGSEVALLEHAPILSKCHGS
jgi:hypothetical protein